MTGTEVYDYRHPCAVLAGQNRAGAVLVGTSVIPSATSDALCA